jgi:hypothetical protein
MTQKEEEETFHVLPKGLDVAKVCMAIIIINVGM